MGRLVPALFWVLLALHIASVWVVDLFPTQDGAAHLYNASLLERLLWAENTLPAGRYEINSGLTTNWVNHLLLIGLMEVATPAAAEKLLVCAYYLLFAFALKVSVGSLRPENAGLCLPAFAFLPNFLLHLGFYSYILGIPVGLLAAALWIRQRGDPRGKEAGVFAGLLVLAYAVHLLALFLPLMITGSIALAEWARKPSDRQAATRVVRLCLSSLPAAMLAVIFVFTSTARGEFAGRREMTFLDRFLVNFPLYSGEMWSFLAGGLVLLFLAWLLAMRLVRGRDRESRWLDGLLAAAAIQLVMLAAGPDTTHSGSFLLPRVYLSLLLTVLLWLAGQQWGPGELRAATLAGAALAVVFLVSVVAGYPPRSSAMQAIQRAATKLHPGATLLHLRFANLDPENGELASPPGIDNALHAGGRVALAAGAEWLNNYQARTETFPLRYRDRQSIKLLEDVKAFPPCVDIGKFEEVSGIRVDYILTTGYPDNARGPCNESLQRILASDYELVYDSRDTHRIRLYRTKRFT